MLVPRTPVTIPRTSCDFVNHRIQGICYQPADFIEIARAVRSHNAYAVLLLTRMGCLFKYFFSSFHYSDGTKLQIVYYQSGVASFADFDGNMNSIGTLLRTFVSIQLLRHPSLTYQFDTQRHPGPSSVSSSSTGFLPFRISLI